MGLLFFSLKLRLQNGLECGGAYLKYLRPQKLDAVKPDDWDEDAPMEIEDEEAVKPEGWLDNEPEDISDPEATKPEDWDDEGHGGWEAP
ncbi:hypothetical protein LOK49_LG14G01369 [Camellia lanceoleosa]|uniref:Uncharacterized protein n=1 Tax=Camellia lanceoleosa TaxID=1840588 RepID=A0ACC0FDA7_9ERIC|nr:hypothetical protein LOK49_LG14G01369 [Camellia lanceoleosa]